MTSRFWYLLSKKMSGELTQDELEELNILISENPEWAYSAGQLQKIWKNNPQEQSPYHSQLAFDDHLNRLKQNGIKIHGFEMDVQEPDEKPFHRPAKKMLWFQAAVVIAVLFAMGLIWQLKTGSTDSSNKKENFSELQTKPGSKIKLILPDSSVVWLNAGSKLTYSEQFGIKDRNTTLTGEAYFDVRKSKIPFIIQTNGVRIKVLGTVFNVRSYPNEKTETSLLRGSVEITLEKRPGEKYMLKSLEKLVVSNTETLPGPSREKKEPLVALQSLSPSNDNTYLETSWVDNKLVFQDESFAELAVKMERWYGVSIKINDEKIAAQRLSGSFTTETIQEAMEALQLSTSFHYSLRSNLITITK